MNPRLSVITLGVQDLGRALAFYRDGLGLRTEGIIGTEFEHGAVVFFELQPGLILALWPLASIAHHTGLEQASAVLPSMTLGHNVGAREEVDTVMAQALAAGANLVQPAADTFYGGYAGYFRDPDGHLWEVVFNTGLLPGDPR